jgi:sortase (surface protein transpeptidase)
MMDNAPGTLDNPALLSRLRREYSQSYTPRPVQKQIYRDLNKESLYIPPVKEAPPAEPPKIDNEFIPLAAPVRAPLMPAPELPLQTIKNNVPTLSISVKNTKNKVDKVASKFKKLKKVKMQHTLVACAIFLFVTGFFIAFMGYKSDRVAKVQAENLTKIANQAQGSTTGTTSGSSAASPALSTVKPSAQALVNYTVAPNLPRYLIIPSLGVDSRVLSVGVNAQGALETPNNVYDTAWYNESAEPGGPGATLIDGHISSWTAHGVFYGLKDLVAGDTIQIVRGDGKVFTYKVVKTVIYPATDVDMSAAMTPVVAGASGLNLISCSGDVIPGTSTFNKRIVVFSELISS